MDEVLTFKGIWKTSLAFLSPTSKKVNSPPTLQGLGARSLGFASSFAHNVKSLARWWTISKGIKPHLHRVITRASRWCETYGSKVKSFSSQNGRVIFLMPKGLEKLGILPKVSEEVLEILQTVKVCDR
ncbi:MAG: hypothetical protein HWQ35_13980 [Nostoc sp. NMS1]|uniref:hypothetical protein n=1 Tax=unclassified Nostoc TaxID=2593658 RepID=UPI0025F0BA34|nr:MULTISPECIES: hypothetical protein [unclassified Nostoc]MBN3907619.1 hypothetical protein [Nostoc sp. NMS1]MBN3993297.1 hypothetical protein [Nostoc sp. NMS2]